MELYSMVPPLIDTSYHPRPDSKRRKKTKKRNHQLQRNLRRSLIPQKKSSKSSKSSKSEDSPKKKKKSSKSEDSPKKKTPKKEAKSPKKETKRSSSKSPKRTTKESSSPAKSTRSASSKKVSEVVKKVTSKRTSKAASSPKTPRGGVKKPLSQKKEKKTPPKTPRGSAKKSSPLSSPSRETSAASSELKWVWQYYDNGFYNYSGVASDVVEGVYQEYLSSPYTTDVRSVKSGQWAYLVDFREMTQQNVEHESHTKRRIRRVQIPVNQVSDLKKKYDDNADDSGSD